MDDDTLKQFAQLEQPQGPVGSDSDFVPRSYEEAVADRAQRRRDALEQRRAQQADQEAIVETMRKRPYIQSTEENKQRTGGRPHDDHLDFTTKQSGAYYRKLSGKPSHSGAYYRAKKSRT